jgi:hypothetical protein
MYGIKTITADKFNFMDILIIQNELIKNIYLIFYWKYYPGNNYNINIQVEKLSASICSSKNDKGL